MNIDNDLCGPCHQFFAGWPAFCKTQNNISEANSRYKAPYHPTIRSWRAAAEHGCCLCTLSLWQFKSKIKREEGQYHVVDIEGVADLKIEVSGWFNDNVWKAISWSIKADTIILGEFHDPSLNWGLNFHAAEMSVDVPIEVSTGSEAALSLIEKWSDECLSSHVPCNSEDLNVAVLPTRLLCVSDGLLRVVNTASLLEKPRYFVLSHCWGLINILRLLGDNLEQFLRAIPEDRLSKTFQDGVLITRKLGYQYIWIDSLCIIQDDAEDWRREASKMSGIYGGAALSIAASGAKDGSVGCFFNRDEDMLKQIHKYQIQLPVGNYQDSAIFTPLDKTNYEDYMEDCPLAERGWVFQERFLAPRTIHFTRSQLYFTCREKICCETFQNSADLSDQNMRIVERTNIPEIWRTVVHNYSQCKLTYEKDKLIAISGVAKWLQLRTGDEYVAGLWQSRLELDLLWDTMEVSTIRPQNEMPSWSWASFNRAVFIPPDKIYGQDYKLMANLVGIDLDFVGDDTFGEVKRGSLRLSTGPLVVANITRPSKYQTRATYLNGAPSKCSYYNDYETDLMPRSTWYFLPLIEWPKGDGKNNIRGLMLERVEGGKNGAFRRVGNFSHQPYNGDDFPDAMNDPACWVEESFYDGLAGIDKLGGKKWYINLI